MRNLRTAVLILFLAALLLGMVSLRTCADQTTLVALFPKSNEVAGWVWKAGPQFFSSDRVFDYMDGAGEIPKGYGLLQLGTTKYQRGNQILELAIFDMGKAENAFGYYSARSFLEHGPGSKDRFIQLDHPAHLEPSVGVLTFWKGRYTVILQPDTGHPDETTLLQFARFVSARIQAKGQPPELLHRLPHQNTVANTFRYVRGKSAFDALLIFIPKDVFGAANGAEAVAAEYRLGATVGTLFLVRYPTGRAASDAYGAYRQYLNTRKAVFGAQSLPGCFVATDKRHKGTGAVTDANLLGVVVGAKDSNAAQTALRRLLVSMRAK